MEGIIIVDKPTGITSFRVVDIIKKKFDLKVGHAGTLDPLATGVLVLAVGRATKKIKYLINENKKYEGTLLLGKQTDSQDITGKVTEEHLGDIVVSKQQVEEMFAEFKGKSEQIPPMVSAIQYQGKRLYKLARQGKTIERKPRSIEVFELELLKLKGKEISFFIFCSKGTYIRTIAADIGDRLGYGGVLSSLRRVSSGKFSIEQAISLSKIDQMNKKEFCSLLIPV